MPERKGYTYCPYCNEQVGYTATCTTEWVACKCCGMKFDLKISTCIKYQLFKDCELNGEEHNWVLDKKPASACYGFLVCSKCDAYKQVYK